MATPLTSARSPFTSLSSEKPLTDACGLVSESVVMPFSEVDASHFDSIVIADEWGEVGFLDLLKELFLRFEEANLSYSQEKPNESLKTKVYEVGSSAAYDAYHPKKALLNPLLPAELKSKCDQIDLHPSNDRDMRFQVNKNTVVRAEELFLAALQKICPGFNRAKFKWREKFYDFHDNVSVLSIKDKQDKQYDFYIYEKCKRPFFASRDAIQLDVTPYIESKAPAKIIVHDYHPLQPYVDRITRTLRIPSPETVNHLGFLLQLFYVMKGYFNPDPNAESVLKETLLKYLQNHNLNELISKFIGNHPSDNAFAFIFSARSRLGQPITSPIPGYTHSQLSVSAQLLNPTEKKLHYNGQDYYLNAPSVDDLKGFDWHCDLVKGINVLDAVLDFEAREPLNPLAKAMFDSYIAQLSEEKRSSALKKRMLRFVNSARRSAVVMQTISYCKLNMARDLFSIVAQYADEGQYGLIINDLSNPEWIKSNIDKAKSVYNWLLDNKNKERLYPFLRCLIPYCDRNEKFALLKRTWSIHPAVNELVLLNDELEKSGTTLKEIFGPSEMEMAPHFSNSRDFTLVLGSPKTIDGKIALFKLYAKEDRLKAIHFAVDAKIAPSLLHELLPLFRKEDSNAHESLITQIAASCTEEQYDALVEHLPPFWIKALSSRAEEVFNWLLLNKRQTKVYPFIRTLIQEGSKIDAASAVMRAFKLFPDIKELLKLSDAVPLPSVFASKENEILPHLKEVSAHEFKAILGEPKSQEAKIALYSILCRENLKEAALFASLNNLSQDIVNQFLTTLEAGKESDREHLKTYLDALSYDERILFWKNWLQKKHNPFESPLFPWVLNELRMTHNQSLFLSLIKAALPQGAREIANLQGAWITENPPIVSRLIEILSKDNSEDYLRFLRRLVKEDQKEAVPSHLRKIWEKNPHIDSFCELQKDLSERGLKLSCVFPGMEKELSKPYGKALHDVKKAFDPSKFTLLANLNHPHHLDALTFIAANNPSWVKDNPDEAFELFNKLIESSKIQSLELFIPILFREGEASNLQECVKKAWPLIRKAKFFLELKEALDARGVSISVIFRPLEEEVLKSLEEHNQQANVAEAFFGSIETPQGKKIYLNLLMRGKKEAALAYAVGNRLEVDFLERSEGPLRIDLLKERSDWTKEEIDRLWNLAEKRVDFSLISALLPISRSGFEAVLKRISLDPALIEKSSGLFPEIIKEPLSVAKSFLFAQKEMLECARCEIPRLLKEATMNEKIALLRWMKSHNVQMNDYVDYDLDLYKEEFFKRLDNEAEFNEFYHIVGKKPFERLWEEKSFEDRVLIAKKCPFIFKQKELISLLVPIKEKIFLDIPLPILELLEIEPESQSQFLCTFKSKVLFERFYPKYFEKFGHASKNLVALEEYNTLFDYLIGYRSQHILSLLHYHESFTPLLIERKKEFINEGYLALKAMETELEKEFYTFARKQKYVPYKVLKSFIDSGNFFWFNEWLEAIHETPCQEVFLSSDFQILVTKGLIRFENEYSLRNDGKLNYYATLFTLGLNPLDAFELLRSASSPILKEISVKMITDILEGWKADPKKIDPKVEEKIGRYIAESIQKGTRETCKFLYAEPLKSLLNEFPNVCVHYRVPLSLLLLNQAKETSSIDQKLVACKEVIVNLKTHLHKNPESASSLIDVYLSVISETIDNECDINQIRFFSYAFLLMLISPDAIQSLQTTIGIPEIKLIKEPKNLAVAVSYTVKLLDILLSKKYSKNAYLYFALDTTQLLIMWLLPKAKEYSKQLLPLLKKRIYFIPSTPEFHYSEFVLVNQKIIELADKILSPDVKAEYSFASNLKMTDNSEKLLPCKVEGFNRYALNFLSFNKTRPAQHVLTQLAELLPAYKKLKDLKIKEIFSALIKQAAIDPKEPTATGVAFLIRVKEVFSDYFKTMHEFKEKEREKYLNDYLQLSHELIRAFFSVCDKIPEYLGIYSDFLTMIELENFIDSRYDAYFEMLESVMPQWVGITEELDGLALDPMTVLVLCQADKIPEKFRKRQSLSMEKWFDILVSSKKQKYVRLLIEEYPAVTEICTPGMLKKYG